LRASVGVIFQDFVRYAMRFDENIGVGRVDSVREHLDRLEAEDVRLSLQDMSANGGRPRESGSADAARANGSHPSSRSTAAPIGVESHPAIAGAAEQSLAASMLPRLPLGYRQMLGRRFENGVDLSGGEWQKVALARAYMRDAQILILDEPTAALDARAEYEVFARFSELVAGRMAVLISHRFSTVRMADRILVLTGGQIVEDGTHEQLVARGGLYQELFDMQAEGYR
jgi:ATP-binding cassette subfamily B protein